MQASTSYIYIIFAVVYAIYSIIKAGKKVTSNRPTVDKQGQPSPAVTPPTASSLPNAGEDFRKMFQDILGGTQEKKNPEAQIPKPKSQPVFEKIQYKHAVQQHMEHPKAATHVFDKEKAHAIHEKPPVSKKPVTEIPAEQETAVDFDFRQAIIYSEILKRPEY